MITYANLQRLLAEGKLQARIDNRWVGITLAPDAALSKDRREVWYQTSNGWRGRTEKHCFNAEGVMINEDFRIKPGVICNGRTSQTYAA